MTMPIARGSRSSLAWAEESTLGTAPSGNWLLFPFISEGFDESIGTIQGQDMRPDRSNPSLRGGNIVGNGSVNADFGPRRHMTWMKHLLGATHTVVPLTSGVPNAADSTAYVVGQWVTGSSSTLWQCTTAGTTSTGVVAALTGASPVTSGGATFAPRKGAAVANSTAYALYDIVTGNNGSRWQCTVAGTSSAGAAANLTGASTAVSGTATFTYLVGDLLQGVAYRRGDVVLDNSGNLWTCTKGGTAHSSVLKSQLTGTGEVSIQSTTTVMLKFQYLGAPATGWYRHTMVPGSSWPTAGLAFEKAIVGGSSTSYFVFTGVRINSLELSVPQDGIVSSTWSMLNTVEASRSGSSAAGTAAAIVGESPYSGFNSYIGVNEIIGNAERAVQSASLTISNNADESMFVIGRRTRASIAEGTRRANGRFTMFFLDSTEYDLFKNETTVPLLFSFIWSGRLVSFYFGEAKLTGSGTPQVRGSGGVTADFEWTAFQDTGSTDMTVTWINESAVLPRQG